MSADTAGVVAGRRAAQYAKELFKEGDDDTYAPGVRMLPILDANNRVVAYERAVDPEQIKGLQRDENLARMLGVWSGRIFEEEAAHAFNTQLVETVKETWEAQKTTRKGEFINVAQSDDPVIQDAWNTLGWRLKEQIRHTFGGDFLPVRKDMLEDVLGYRAAGITDFWTGTTRFSPETQKRVRQLFEMFLGKGDAYKWLYRGDRLVRSVNSL